MNVKTISLAIALGTLVLLSACGGGEKKSASDTSYSSSEDLTEKSDVTSAGETASSSEDINQMLDDYEEYVDGYLKFYKKAMNGDNSAMTEYAAMLEKATALQQSMTKAQNDKQMNANQIQRMMEIQMKMTNAVLEMQK